MGAGKSCLPVPVVARIVGGIISVVRLAIGHSPISIACAVRTRHRQPFFADVILPHRTRHDAPTADPALKEQAGQQVFFDPCKTDRNKKATILTCAKHIARLCRAAIGEGIMAHSTGKFILLAGTWAILAGVAAPTFAQVVAANQTAPPPAPTVADAASPAATGGLDDIVVTATKRGGAQNVQNVPFAVTAFGPLQLEQQHVRSIQGLSTTLAG